MKFNLGLETGSPYISLCDQFQMCTYGNGVWVIIRDLMDQCMISKDCSEWIVVDIGVVDDWLTVTYQNGMFMIVGMEYVAWSLDAVEWNYQKIDWDSVDLTSDGMYYHASDFEFHFDVIVKERTSLAIDYPDKLPIISKDDDGYFGILQDTKEFNTHHFITSEHGTTWRTSSFPMGKWITLGYGDGKWIVIGYDSRVMVYTDGRWKLGNFKMYGIWYSVCYGNGIWLALLAGSNTAAKSVDGIHWDLISLPLVDVVHQNPSTNN